VTQESVLYHCRWTPFINHQFSSSISATWINGQQIFDGQNIIEQALPSQRLAFDR